MADAPNQFAASAVGGWMGWDDPGTADGQEVEGGSLLGVELETRVSRYVHFRLGAAYGRASITGPDPEGASRTVDANQIVLELAATPRLSVGPLRRSGVVPFGVLGAGSVVHDPRTEPGQFDPALPTRSQGSLVYGAGVEVAPPALGDVGIRAEWRRAQVQLQNPFEPTSLEGTARGSSRFMGSVHWSF